MNSGVFENAALIYLTVYLTFVRSDEEAFPEAFFSKLFSKLFCLQGSGELRIKGLVLLGLHPPEERSSSRQYRQQSLPQYEGERALLLSTP